MSLPDLRGLDLLNTAGLVVLRLAKHGIHLELIGEACVAIYSEGQYETHNLEFACQASQEALAIGLRDLAFESPGESWSHPLSSYALRFNQQLSFSSDAALLTSAFGPVRLLTAHECVKERLLYYFKTGNAAYLEEAALVARLQPIDLEELRDWSTEAGCLSKFCQLQALLTETQELPEA